MVTREIPIKTTTCKFISLKLAEIKKLDIAKESILKIYRIRTIRILFGVGGVGGGRLTPATLSEKFDLTWLI